MSANHHNLFDAEYAENLVREVLEPVIKFYFRLKTVGQEHIPAPDNGRPVIFVANHAGRSFPWDGVLLEYAIGHQWVHLLGYDTTFKPQSLIAPELSQHPRLLPYRLHNWWYRLGCSDATASNFVRLLKHNQNVVIFPEGIPGIAKDFKDRYQLLPFPTPLVRLAQRYNALIVPVSIVGSEYFHPFARKVGWLNRIGQRLGLPFLPLSPFSVWLPLLPWLFYSALPAPVTVVFGEPLEPDEPTAHETWDEVSAQLHHHCQEQLNQARASYEHGMDWGGLLVSLLRAPEPFWKLLPMFWPWRFLTHARRYPRLFPELPPRWWFYAPVLGWADPPQPTPEKVQTGFPVSAQPVGLNFAG